MRELRRELAVEKRMGTGLLVADVVVARRDDDLRQRRGCRFQPQGHGRIPRRAEFDLGLFLIAVGRCRYAVPSRCDVSDRQPPGSVGVASRCSVERHACTGDAGSKVGIDYPDGQRRRRLALRDQEGTRGPVRDAETEGRQDLA
jgi:hypothetical protein